MNRVYRLVWNRSLAVVQVTGELTRARSRSSGTVIKRSPRRHPLALAITALALAWIGAPAWSQTCTPADPSGCGAAGGIGGRAGRSPIGGAGNGTGGDAIVWNPNTSESAGNTATAGVGGSGANGVFIVGATNITSNGGVGGGVGATGSTGVGASVTGGTGSAGQAESGASIVGGGGGGGGAGVYINDGNSAPIVGTTTTLAGGIGGRGGDATAAIANGNATNGDPGAGGGGGAGVIIAAGAGGVSLINNGRMLGGSGGNGGNGGYAGSGGGGGDGLLVLGAGSAVTNNTTGSIIGGLGGNPGIYQDGGNLPGGYGGGGAGVNLVGAGSSLENAGTIVGGNANTVSLIPSAQDGQPGVGVRGWGGTTVITDGTIAGGNNGNVQADSVLFSGGGNQIVLLAGASFTGNIQSISGSTNGGDIFTLAGDVNGSLNAGLIVGFATNTKTGNSNWTLTGTGNAGIGWFIEQGELTGNSSAFRGSLTFVGNGIGTPTVDFNQATTGLFASAISGAGQLIKDGAGSLTLSGDLSTYSGTFALNLGTVALTGNGNLQGAEISDGATLDISGISGSTATIAGLSGSGAVTLGSHTLVIDNAANDNFSGGISGNGGITLNGGTQTFSGSNAYVGGTTINGGKLVVSSDANLGNSSGSLILDGGTLENTATFTTARNVVLVNGVGGTWQTDASLTITGNVTGNGVLVKTGTGTLILSGTNAYTGGTTVNAGTLQGDTGSLQGNIRDNTVLVFNQTGSGSYGGVISGGGTLTVDGTGALTLNGVNTSTGLTTVASGATLIVGDSAHVTATVAGDVSVNGGTLGGFGTIQGSATLSNSAALTPGNTLAVGTLTIGGDLTIGSGSQLNYDFGSPGPNFSTPGQSDHVVVNGNLSIGSSTLRVNNLGSMGPGLYNLVTWGGALSITGGGFAPPSGMSLQILTANKQINLVDTQGLTLDEWDANGLAGPSQMGGGSGTWSTSSNTWSDTSGQFVGPMAPQPGFAIFGGAAGTVMVDDTNGQVGATGMQFVSDGYHLTGGAIDLVGQSGVAPVLRVSSGDTAIIDNVLAGTDGLNKTDGGTLVLGGANLYTGTTTLSGGYLSVSSDANLGASTNPLDFEGGTLEITGTGFTQTARTIIWGNPGGGFDIDNAANTFTVTQALTGSGGLLKSGAGTLVLTGTNTYSGGTVIAAGILQGDTASLQGDITNNATLVFAQAGNGSFSGAISGSGQLIKNGNGTLILSGTNTYAGGTTLNAGTLQGDTNSLQGTITDNAALVFDQAGNGTYNGVISGTGSLTKTGAGTLILTGANVYSGGTTISAGQLQGNSRSLQGNIIDNAVLMFDESYQGTATGTYGGIISGTGSLIVTGTGVLALTGTNTYSGGTTITSGTLEGNTTSIQGNVVDNGTLIFDQAGGGAYDGVISGSGSLVKTGAGTLSLNGANTYNGGTVIDAGILQGDAASLHGNIVDNATLVFAQASDGSFSGLISGGGQLIKNGSGTLILSGIDAYTGGITINAGSLQLTTGALQGNITDNASLIFNQSSDSTYRGIISGSGSLTKTGAGTLILDAANTYTGGTTVSGGTLEVGDSDTATASIQGAVDVQNGGTLRGHGTVIGDVISDGLLWPGGSMGTLTIQGNYTQNADGTLQFDVTPTQSSLLKVSGHASLAGTLDLIFAPGTYHTSTFPLVQAGSLSGTFSTVNGTVPGAVNSQISYSSTQADLVLTSRAVTPLDSTLFGNLMRSVNLAGQQDMGSVLDVALTSLHTQCGADHAPSMQNVTSSCGNGAWAQYTGSAMSLDGSNGSDSTAFGLLGGADHAIGDVVHIGLQAGVGRVNGNDRLGGNSRVDNVHGGIYAYADAGPLVLSAVVDTMHSDYHFNRITGIGTATSTPHGNMLSAAWQAAWPLQLAQWRFTPKAGVLYQRQTLDGFHEALDSTQPDASSFPIDGKRSRYNSLQPYAVMAIEHSFVAQGVTYVPEVSLGYRYNTHRATMPVVQVTAQDGTMFELPGTAQGRGMGMASARVTAQAGASWSLYVDYQGFFGSRLNDNALSFGFIKRF